MALGDFMPNYLPKNVFESDDEIDNWSSLSGSSNSSGSPCQKVETDFSLFQDYFGLSNLLNNVKISEDNPLLYSSHRNLFNRRRRLSLESEGSDTNAVTSPRLENSHAFDLNSKFPNPESKTLPPPSMRLSKADRDMIISGIYTKQLVLEQQQMHPSSKTAPQQQIPSSVHPPSPPHQCPSPPQEPATNRAVSMNVCVFCRNNGENENVYTSHVLKDSDGRTSCPILRAYTCPICKANGDNSHTIKYCPLNQNGRANTTFPPPPSQQQMPPPPPPMGMMPPQRTPAGFPQPPMRNFRPPFPNFPPPPNARIPQAASKSR